MRADEQANEQMAQYLSCNHRLSKSFTIGSVLFLSQTVDANSNHEITSKAECCHIKDAVNVTLSTERNDDIG